MQMIFSDEEMKYIDTEMFNFNVKPDCPPKLKKVIIEKINKINKYGKEVANGGTSKSNVRE